MLTIAICTYNRARLLGDALASLAECDAPDSAWELLVVDNNSSDDTQAVASSFCDKLPIRIVFEREQGLSAARNRAIKECRGDWLLFTDDDVRLDRRWLRTYESALAAYPEAGFAGGRVLPYWPEGRPGWLKDEGLALISGLLVRYHLGDSTRLYAPDEPTPFGASFGISRQVFEAIGGFHHGLGVKGNVPGRGEEAEYLGRVIAAGWSGVYVGDAVAHHWTDARRLTLAYLYRYGVQKGIAARRMGSDSQGSLGTAMAFGLRGCWQLLRGRGDRFRQCVINMGIQRGLRVEVPGDSRG